MTFERFYSIIRPHKAASFNTVKKAKIIIVSIFVFFTVFNIPHPFFIEMDGLRLYGLGKDKSCSWTVLLVYFNDHGFYFALYSLLLAMNCVIIHTLKSRSNLTISRSQSQGQGCSEGHAPKSRNPDNQITVTLLVVTFSFLALTTPAYLNIVYLIVVGMGSTPKGFATSYLFYHLGEKML